MYEHFFFFFYSNNCMTPPIVTKGALSRVKLHLLCVLQQKKPPKGILKNATMIDSKQVCVLGHYKV